MKGIIRLRYTQNVSVYLLFYALFLKETNPAVYFLSYVFLIYVLLIISIICCGSALIFFHLSMILFLNKCICFFLRYSFCYYIYLFLKV